MYYYSYYYCNFELAGKRIISLEYSRRKMHIQLQMRWRHFTAPTFESTLREGMVQ